MDINKYLTAKKEHMRYGVKQIRAPVKKLNVSTRKHKKYVVELNNGKKIHFGDRRYDHYKDRHGDFSMKDHHDPVRRAYYLARATKIKDKNGKLTMNNPMSPNFYAIRMLW